MNKVKDKKTPTHCLSGDCCERLISENGNLLFLKLKTYQFFHKQARQLFLILTRSVTFYLGRKGLTLRQLQSFQQKNI